MKAYVKQSHLAPLWPVLDTDQELDIPKFLRMAYLVNNICVGHIIWSRSPYEWAVLQYSKVSIVANLLSVWDVKLKRGEGRGLA